MADVLAKKGEQYAATGLAAAWLLDHFAGFRLVTFYLADPPELALLNELGFREADAGANTWLVVPNDDAYFTVRATRKAFDACIPFRSTST
jgi:hypothetical protein